MIDFLQDKDFLNKIDTLPVKEQFVRITILSWKEEIIQEIQGRVISGNVNISSSSIVRRTANLTLFAPEQKNDLTNIDQLISINKKIKIELGIVNTIPEYTDIINNQNINYQDMYGDIVWFPLGIYVIFNPNVSHSASGVTISIQLRDKMCLLNGDAGGVIPAATTFNVIQTELQNGDIEVTYPTISRIIRECVNHLGGQDLSKIIIEDLEQRAKRVLRYIGDMPLYEVKTSNDYIYTLEKPNPGEGILLNTFNYGDDIGYDMTDFTYPGQLNANAGDTITSVLDKIVTLLGNYEYFYDVNGLFHFQQIKNYLNTSYYENKKNVEEIFNDKAYSTDYSKGKAVYTFDNSELFNSTSNSPKFDNIKNDFVVWGSRQTPTGLKLPIRYHLSIDKRPEINHTYQVYLYEDKYGVIRAAAPMKYAQGPFTGNTNADWSIRYNYSLDQDNYLRTEYFPFTGRQGKIYFDVSSQKTYKWVSGVNVVTVTTQDGPLDVDSKGTYVEITTQNITTKDWREQLYYQGIESIENGIDAPYYFTELNNEFPKLYDLALQEFKEDEIYNLDFYLDIIDSSATIGEYCVDNIGRRSKVITDDKVNCIFEPQIPDIVLIDNSLDENEIKKLMKQNTEKGQNWSVVKSNIMKLVVTGGTHNSAYNMICDLLYQYTNMRNSISITSIPIYYLEPNTRITVRDQSNGISGDYMIDSISLPLDCTGMMSINAYSVLQKI